MISEKNYDIGFSPSKVFMSDNPIRSKLYCRVFIDKIGEGTWEVVNENEYDVINDSIVFSEFPIGKFLSMQVSTTPAELMQSPTENTIIVSIKNEIKEVANVAGNIITVADSIDDLGVVSDNITKVQTVSDSITNVNNVGNNIVKVNTVSDNVVKVNTVSDSIVKVNTVSDNVTNVNNVGNSIVKVNTVSDNITKVDVVASNVPDIHTVASNIVDVQNAEENANSALLSKNLAEKWASELEDIPVSDGKYSAYHWALKAFELVSGGTIDDTAPSSIKTYSSNKIEAIINALDLSDIDETVTLKHFTATLLNKLNGIEENANNYTHPASHPASMIDESVARRFVSDTEKSTWNGKQDALVSGTNIKTINDNDLTGSGNISIINLSGITAYHLLQGNLAVSNSTITQGFNTTLYTSGTATTNIDSDTQWGNAPEERFGVLSILKDRIEATNLFWYDTVRGATKEINSNTTEAETTLAGGLTAFNSTGFTVGADAGHNSTANNMVSWNFQTTHRVSGTTNHGKAYTCHYNPFTGFMIVKYEGSGIAGHEIPHHLGRKLDFVAIKNLNTTNGWLNYTGDSSKYMQFNTTASLSAVSVSGEYSDFNIYNSVLGTNVATNGNTNQHIMYGWANSYFDESNKLIGNYELVTYQGTGVAGNKVKTKGKPAWVMIKCTSATGDWTIKDNQRGSTKLLYVNSSIVEQTEQTIDFVLDGFIVQTADQDTNTSGGQYIALVAYDTNSNGGGSYYPLASDASNVQINNALIPLAQGIEGNGAKNTILSKNETITGLTYTQGKNYVYCDKNGSYGVTPYKPRYLKSELVRTFASEAPEYYDVVKNKWFNTSGHGELVTNGTFDSNTTGWSTTTGFTMSVQNGTLKIDRNIATPTGGVYQNIVTTIGKKYRLILDIDYISGGDVSIWVDSGNTLSTYVTVVGKQSIEFTAINSSTKIEFLQTGVAGTGTINIDNISVFATEIVPTTEITNSRNYLNHIVHADSDGGVLYVEELPKIEYKDIVKASEFRGKNACTAWANIDMTTTPPTIRDSYGITGIIRTATGRLSGYVNMDRSDYIVIGSGEISQDGVNASPAIFVNPSRNLLNTTSQFNIEVRGTDNNNYNAKLLEVFIMGGKN